MADSQFTNEQLAEIDEKVGGKYTIAGYALNRGYTAEFVLLAYFLFEGKTLDDACDLAGAATLDDLKVTLKVTEYEAGMEKLHQLDPPPDTACAEELAANEAADDDASEEPATVDPLTQAAAEVDLSHVPDRNADNGWTAKGYAAELSRKWGWETITWLEVLAAHYIGCENIKPTAARQKALDKGPATTVQKKKVEKGLSALEFDLSKAKANKDAAVAAARSDALSEIASDHEPGVPLESTTDDATTPSDEGTSDDGVEDDWTDAEAWVDSLLGGDLDLDIGTPHEKHSLAIKDPAFRKLADRFASVDVNDDFGAREIVGSVSRLDTAQAGDILHMLTDREFVHFDQARYDRYKYGDGYLLLVRELIRKVRWQDVEEARRNANGDEKKLQRIERALAIGTVLLVRGNRTLEQLYFERRLAEPPATPVVSDEAESNTGTEPSEPVALVVTDEPSADVIVTDEPEGAETPPPLVDDEPEPPEASEAEDEPGADVIDTDESEGAETPPPTVDDEPITSDDATAPSDGGTSDDDGEPEPSVTPVVSELLEGIRALTVRTRAAADRSEAALVDDLALADRALLASREYGDGFEEPAA